MKRIILICSLIYMNTGLAQLTLDIELLGGALINSKKYNYSDENYAFNVKNGILRGIGFDLNISYQYALSLTYLKSSTVTRSKINFPEESRLSQSNSTAGILNDNIVQLGIKRKFQLENNFQFIPFVGLYYNNFLFDNEDRKYTSTLHESEMTYMEDRDIYARFNNSHNSSNHFFYGAFGTSLGLGIEKTFPSVGRFSLNVGYNIDLLRKVEQVIHASIYDFSVNNTDNTTTVYYHSVYEKRELARNTLHIELGFKMPCSILLKN